MARSHLLDALLAPALGLLSGLLAPSLAQADLSTRASFMYVMNDADDTISIYAVDPTTGRLSFEGYQAAAVGEEGPVAALVHPNGNYLFVANSTTANISTFAIDGSTGRLSPLAPTPTGISPHDMALDAAGDFLYVTAYGDDAVHTYSVDAVSGALAQVGSPLVIGSGPDEVALDPLGRFAYVTEAVSRNIAVLDIDGVTGELTASVAPADISPGIPGDIVVNEGGTHAYVSVVNVDLLLTFTIDGATGELTLINSRATGDQPMNLALRPGGAALYLLNAGDGDLIGYSIAPGSGVATRIPGTFETGLGPARIAFDPSGLSAYVCNSSSRDVSCYAIDGITLAPTAGRPIRARNAPAAIALRGAGSLTKQGRHLYTLNEGAATISGFEVDDASGSLSSVGPDTLTGAGPRSLAADPLGRFLYTVDAGANVVSTYTIDVPSGVLSLSPTTEAIAGAPQAAVVDPSGLYLFVALDVFDIVVSYAIDQATGLLSVLGTRGVGNDVRTITTDPTGQFVYVSRATGHVEGFMVEGGLAVGANFQIGLSGNPRKLQFSPTGDRAYVPLRAIDRVVPLDIDAFTGGLTTVPPGAVTGDQPTGVVIHPTGDFAYAAILEPAGTGALETFGVDFATGDLTGLDSSTAGTNPRGVALDPSGRHLFVSNEGSDEVTLFSIDQGTGLPTSVSATASGAMPTDLVMTTSFVTPTAPDCNTNGRPDHLDISLGISLDCNANCIPDECETPDCNDNDVPDECDLAFGASADCNTNGLPDECDIASGTSLDCNSNGVPDACDLSSGTSQDCNSNGIPDDCDPDCDMDGTPDDCVPFVDCNLNGIVDECDLALGTSLDVNLNGTPDECECGSVSNYCITSPHTAGPGGVMGSAGNLHIGTNNLTLQALACPPQKTGIFFYGNNQVQITFGNGLRCVGGMTQRINPAVMTNMAGTASLGLDLSSFPFTGGGNSVTPGSTWNFQFWFRDQNAPPPDAGYNLTDGLSITFCP